MSACLYLTLLDNPDGPIERLSKEGRGRSITVRRDKPCAWHPLPCVHAYTVTHGTPWEWGRDRVIADPPPRRIDSIDSLTQTHARARLPAALGVAAFRYRAARLSLPGRSGLRCWRARGAARRRLTVLQDACRGVIVDKMQDTRSRQAPTIAPGVGGSASDREGGAVIDHAPFEPRVATHRPRL